MITDTFAMTIDEFNLFQTLLVEESGLYFDKDRTQSVQPALWQRTQELGLRSYAEYYNLLRSHPEGQLEMRELLDIITVGETYFFRNAPHFEVLMKSVLPELIQKKLSSSDRSIRIWSAGCSRGDEPYSIAIALKEVVPSFENWNISIIATDINRNALIAASEGTYNKRAVSHIPAEYLAKYFVEDGKKYILNSLIKNMVKFESLNLATQPFAHGDMQGLDIIFCRNVMIYFDAKTIKNVVDKFYDNLSFDGYMFLGHADSLWQISNKFELVEFPNAFIYKKSRKAKTEGRKPFVGVPEIRLEEIPSLKESVLKEDIACKKPLPKMVKKEPDPLYKEAIQLFNKKSYDEAKSLLDKIVAKDKDNVRAHFAIATILSNQAKYEKAINELTIITHTDNLYVEAYYLLGVLWYKTGNLKEAESQFRKVLYIDPDIVLAYFNLGNIYIYQRMFTKAAREISNAVKLLENRPEEEHIRFSEGFNVEFLLRACKNNLGKLTIERGRSA